LGGKILGDCDPTHAQKAAHGWGTHCVAGAGERQKQEQPQILPSAEKRFAQDDTAVVKLELFSEQRSLVG
jgi:hypothetical protein